jgi:beta-glucosidase
LIKEVSAANPNTVVVLTTGGAVEMDSWDSAVPAVLEAWYGGQEQGTAIANILFGAVDPSGRLPITFPHSIDQTPTSTPEQFPGVGLDVQYSEGIFVGYRGYTKFGIEPKYPFGYGLSYNDELETRVNKLPRQVHVDDETGLIRQDDLVVPVKVKNHSDRAGTEVIQVYAGALPGVDSAERVLAGWAKLTVDAGDQVRHSLRLDPQSFAYWDTAANEWATPTGKVELFVGDSVETAESVGTLVVKNRH